MTFLGFWGSVKRWRGAPILKPYGAVPPFQSHMARCPNFKAIWRSAALDITYIGALLWTLHGASRLQYVNSAFFYQIMKLPLMTINIASHLAHHEVALTKPLIHEEIMNFHYVIRFHYNTCHLEHHVRWQGQTSWGNSCSNGSIFIISCKCSDICQCELVIIKQVQQQQHVHHGS